MRRMTVTLQQDEREALITLAQRERRDPRAQAAVLIRHELERFGLLPPATAATQEQKREARDDARR